MPNDQIHQLNEQAYQLIWRKLERGDLGPGDLVNARAIGREFGASFTPVREAIARLTDEGVLQHQYGVGAFVTVPTRKDVVNLYQLREAIESFAAEQAANGLAIDPTPEMQRANQRLRQLTAEILPTGPANCPQEKSNEWIAADRQFHRALLKSLDNEALSSALERTMSWLVVWKRWAPMGNRAKTGDDHDQIIDAIQRGDGIGARKLVAAHLHQGKEAILKDFDRFLALWKRPLADSPQLGSLDAERQPPALQSE